LVSVHC